LPWPAGLIVAYDVRRRLLRARLQREGASEDATVTGVGPTNFSVNRAPQWVIRYRYVDSRGRIHTGKSEYLSPEEAQEWKEGDVGHVRYDRQRPAQNVWFGRSIPRES